MEYSQHKLFPRRRSILVLSFRTAIELQWAAECCVAHKEFLEFLIASLKLFHPDKEVRKIDEQSLFNCMADPISTQHLMLRDIW